MSSCDYLKVGTKIKCLFQNSDHALEARIFSTNIVTNTAEVIYE